MNRMSPPVGRPGQPCGHARNLGALSHLGEELLRSQELGDLRRMHGLGCVGQAFRHLDCDGAADVGDLAFQVAHARFARVLLDDGDDGFLVEADLGFSQAVLGDLFGHQVPLGDLQLLLARVARELQHLHAVAQGGRDGLQDVGGGDEHHAGQVELTSR